jgi:positive regulator of sigma E activity
MSLLLYIVPFVIFLISTIIMYSISADEDKNKVSTICIRNILPSALLGTLVFVIIKFKDSNVFNAEPMMRGNYFD